MSQYFDYMSMLRNDFGYHDPIKQTISRPFEDYPNLPRQPTPSYTTLPVVHHDFNDDPSATLDYLTWKVEWLEFQNF